MLGQGGGRRLWFRLRGGQRGMGGVLGALLSLMAERLGFVQARCRRVVVEVSELWSRVGVLIRRNADSGTWLDG